MTFTFNENLADDLSQVRFHVGDTSSPGAVADETIQFYLTKPTSVLGTAAAIAWALAAKYAKLAEVTVDDQSVKNSSISSNYTALAKRLEQQDGQSPTTSGGAYGGGILVQGLDDCSKPTDPTCCDYAYGWPR